MEKHKLFDTVIEVMDLSTGRVLASKRVDPWISGYLNDGSNLYVSAREDDQGNQYLELLRLKLSRGLENPDGH